MFIALLKTDRIASHFFVTILLYYLVFIITKQEAKAMDFPVFKYHPDPVKNKSISEWDKECCCCGEKRGWVYTSNVESLTNKKLGGFCPWCINDGSAAEKFDVFFHEVDSLYVAGLSEDVVEEVCRRTPAHNALTYEPWLSHCGDACEYHGKIKKADLKELSESQRNFLQKYSGLDKEEWINAVDGKGSLASWGYLKFICRHCGELRVGFTGK